MCKFRIACWQNLQTLKRTTTPKKRAAYVRETFRVNLLEFHVNRLAFRAKRARTVWNVHQISFGTLWQVNCFKMAPVFYITLTKLNEFLTNKRKVYVLKDDLLQSTCIFNVFMRSFSTEAILKFAIHKKY